MNEDYEDEDGAEEVEQGGPCSVLINLVNGKFVDHLNVIAYQLMEGMFIVTDRQGNTHLTPTTRIEDITITQTKE